MMVTLVPITHPTSRLVYFPCPLLVAMAAAWSQAETLWDGWELRRYRERIKYSGSPADQHRREIRRLPGTHSIAILASLTSNGAWPEV